MGNAVLESVGANNHSHVLEDANVADVILDRLTAFDKAIAESDILEVDGLCVDNKPHDVVVHDSRIKVINHEKESAVEVEIETILKTPLADLIMALETLEFVKCYGITRIVGYYSRVNNWNLSKRSELIDRHKGLYGLTGA
ncbi:hypothetical protein KsCSTR_18390 [Candidatus Kuenenia stuttgartiensis]|uniref:Uncharacterized protein n=1 Tax=Kuenenia stuttgartiensis TaxID=174633 RepID=A0A6G7GNP9_KUEST|nr:hypothetical protein [Candidatus Kuenenia stuttgartiensis]QII11218.1 hypothetical protein KsCSTR_18390 [Candidatus Kuenenia stuttgartiensis]